MMLMNGGHETSVRGPVCFITCSMEVYIRIFSIIICQIRGLLGLGLCSICIVRPQFQSLAHTKGSLETLV